jgi:two-component system response regulator EvgA
MKRVIIVDDHPVTRFAIRMLLEKEGLEIIGETGDGLEALPLVKKSQPDIVIVDIDIDSMDGIELVTRLRRNNYSGGVLILTGKDGEHYIKNCVSAGADGFINKSNNLADLNLAVQAIIGGYGYFPLKRARQHAVDSNEVNGQDEIASLSMKELQALRYLAKGLRLVDIGIQMNISHKTVGTYKRRIMTKLGLSTMKEIYEFCTKNKID